jgi:hypothetical protein
VAGSCEHGNEPSGSIRGEEVLDYLSDYQLLKMESVVLNRPFRELPNTHQVLPGDTTHRTAEHLACNLRTRVSQMKTVKLR